MQGLIQRYPVPPVPGGERLPHRGGAGVHGRLGPQERQGRDRVHPAAPQALTKLCQYQRDIRQREGQARQAQYQQVGKVESTMSVARRVLVELFLEIDAGLNINDCSIDRGN